MVYVLSATTNNHEKSMANKELALTDDITDM